MLDLTPVYDDEPLSVSQMVFIPKLEKLAPGLNGAIRKLKNTMWKHCGEWIGYYEVNDSEIILVSDRQEFSDTCVNLVVQEVRSWVIGDARARIRVVEKQQRWGLQGLILKVGSS